MRKKAVLLAKGQDEEKVGISLKIPKSLKERLQKYSEMQSVSMNALITACIELMLDEDYNELLLRIYAELRDEAESIKEQIMEEHQSGVNHGYESEPEFMIRLKNLEDSYSTTKALLKDMEKYI